MTWELRDVQGMDIEATMDGSDMHTIINRTVNGRVRIDVMRTSDNDPLLSYVGEADTVRKHVIGWLYNSGDISSEHASWIGYELARAAFDPAFSTVG